LGRNLARSARRISIRRREIASLQETTTARTLSRLVDRERSARDHARFIVTNHVKENRRRKTEIDKAPRRNCLFATRRRRVSRRRIVAAIFSSSPKFLTAIPAGAASSRPAPRSRADASRPATWAFSSTRVIRGGALRRF